MKTHTLAFIDVETTGLDPDIHEIIEIGVVLVRQISQEGCGPTLEVVGEFDWKIIPERIFNADPESLKINGYAPEKWTGAKPLKEVMEDFAIRTKSASFVAHNIVMDSAFIECAFARSGVKNLMHYHKIDTISFAFAKLYHDPKVEKFSLRSLCEYFGIENKNAHTALSDARATFELYRRLLDV